MDSPNKDFKPLIPSTCSDSAPVQDSPIFNFISSLSPIKPDKMAPVVQGFSDLSCPPPVFASPETNARRPSIDLKRPQCRPSSHSELSGRDDIAKNISTSADEFKKSTSHICSELEADIDKEHEIKNSAHDLAGSSSGCVNEYLDGISQTGCGDSTTLEDSILKQSEDVPPKMVESCAEGLVSKVHKQNDVVEPDSALVIYKQEEKNSQEFFQSHVEHDKKHGENASNSLTSNICSTFLSAMSAGQATTEHDQTIGAEISNAPAMKMTLKDSKVSQSQLCMRRRLQFGETLENIVANDPCSHSPSNRANSEVTKSSGVDIPATPNNMQLDSMAPSTYPLFTPENNNNGSLFASKPSGIGLHLNSIVNVMPLTCVSNANTKSTEKSYLSARGKRLTSVKTSHTSDVSDYQSNSSNGKLVENASVNIEGCNYENPAYCPSSENTMSLKLIESQELALGQGKANSKKIEIADRFNQSSPKRKRKKTEKTSDGDGCKRCNCKKTKCLKLYCDCFAAGIYCAAPCACQGCFNKPEYDDTVSETRQQIESRNPFAFGPKIVHPPTQPPASRSGENGDRLARSSGRHKKGCNCKRSMCLKKYCECYQANVGCSDGCRCEGCKNIYGKKEEKEPQTDGISDCRISRGMGNTEIMAENWDDSDDGKLKRLPAKSVLLPEFQNVHILTPQTPSFQYSNHGKDSSQARILSRRYIPSPDSNSAVFPPYASMTKSPGDSSSHDMTLDKTKEIFNVVYSDQKSKANKEVIDEFSPGYHVFADTGHLTTIANNPPAMNSASLALGKTSDRGHSRAQFPPSGGQFSSMSTPRWRRSPVTPVDSFGGTRLHQLMDSDSRLGDIMEDDTPEILEETPTPHNTVKVSSPNKKRVSPPKHQLHDFGSTSIKSGRKFILQSISSFPQLTSCVDPEDVNFPNINDAREQNSK